MEIILAIVVASAVSFFGALISMGNERQRKAIDNLQEQITLWAVQDLRIKRERLANEVKVADPLGWLNGITTKTIGYDPCLHSFETFRNPEALVCASGDRTSKFVFTSLSPNEIRRMKRQKQSRLSQYTEQIPLLSLSRNVKAFKLSILNNGILFDLELPLAWKSLTGIDTYQMDYLWIYIFE